VEGESVWLMCETPVYCVPARMQSTLLKILAARSLRPA
jgi:hypothetical protein